MNCAKQYFNNNSQIGVKLNFTQVFGDTATGYNFEVFNPFVVVGVWTRTGNTPNGGVGTIQYTWRGNNIQSGFPYQDLTQSMYCANRDGQNQSGFMTYLPNTSGPDMSNYFKKNMQPGLEVENFGSLMMPPFLIQKFWEDYEASVNAVPSLTLERTRLFNDECQKIFKTTDLRLWMANGKYTMAGSPPNTDSYFAPFDTTFSGGSIGDDGLITLELKSIE